MLRKALVVLTLTIAWTAVLAIVWRWHVHDSACVCGGTRPQRTAADMLSIARVLEDHRETAGTYPQHDGPVSALSDLLEPNHIEKLPTLDGWRNDFQYRSRGFSYELRSLGGDGARGPHELGSTRSLAHDCVLIRGTFVSIWDFDNLDS